MENNQKGEGSTVGYNQGAISTMENNQNGEGSTVGDKKGEGPTVGDSKMEVPTMEDSKMERDPQWETVKGRETHSGRQ